MTCIKCHLEIEQSFKYCPHCGKRQHPIEIPPFNSPSEYGGFKLGEYVYCGGTRKILAFVLAGEKPPTIPTLKTKYPKLNPIKNYDSSHIAKYDRALVSKGDRVHDLCCVPADCLKHQVVLEYGGFKAGDKVKIVGSGVYPYNYSPRILSLLPAKVGAPPLDILGAPSGIQSVYRPGDYSERDRAIMIIEYPSGKTASIIDLSRLQKVEE